MGDVHHIARGRPRKLGEVRWTEGGLRLAPVRPATRSGWFGLAMLTLPLATFLIVFFW